MGAKLKLRLVLAAVTSAALGLAVPAMAQDEPHDVGAWPKVGFETVASLEYFNFSPKGLENDDGVGLRVNSSALVEFNPDWSLSATAQFKPLEEPDPADPIGDLLENQAGRRKPGLFMKEIYVRWVDFRFGKFTQDFGRASFLTPGPYSQDFAEDYELSEQVGVEWIHVFDNENQGWRQLSLSAFMVDRSFLSESLFYNVGRLHFKDGGVGNSRGPDNFMATYDVINQPVANGSSLSYQVSVARLGKRYGAEKNEWWSTAGFDFNIPLNGSVEDTLGGRFSELRLFVEGVHMEDFEGVNGRRREHLTGAAEYVYGPWTFDLTSTYRWTRDPVAGHDLDKLYTATFGYALPSDTLAQLSVAKEEVNGHKGIFAGVRFTQTFSICDRCLVRAPAY
jgi:hypothetical protein